MNIKTKSIVLIILYIILSIILYFYLFKNDKENFINLSNRSDDLDANSYDVVLSRYNEDISWIKNKPFSELNIICYNKSAQQPDEVCQAPTCKVINLKNVGRESHTYLYHIINNYDNLAPVTIFLPASAMDNHKKNITLGVIRKVMKTKTTVLRGDYGVFPDELFNFKIDEWKSSNNNNKFLNPENELVLSHTRPYGKWFKENFGNIKVKVFCYYGIFAVAKEHIVQHPKEHYKKLLRQLEGSSNPEVGHYMERAWGAVFYPYPDSVIYDDYNATNSVFTD